MLLLLKVWIKSNFDSVIFFKVIFRLAVFTKHFRVCGKLFSSPFLLFSFPNEDFRTILHYNTTVSLFHLRCIHTKLKMSVGHRVFRLTDREHFHSTENLKSNFSLFIPSVATCIKQWVVISATKYWNWQLGRKLDMHCQQKLNKTISLKMNLLSKFSNHLAIFVQKYKMLAYPLQHTWQQ